MKIKYFPETDTVYFQLTDHEIVETQELNENTLLDLDANGNLVAITLEHAQSLATISELSFQQMAVAA
jgi:uncharacterized protein YuzE